MEFTDTLNGRRPPLPSHLNLDEQESTGHVKETLEGEMRFFPANAKASIVLEPSDGAFDSPASFGAPQGSAVLGLRAIEPIGCDHLDTLSGQQLIETVTVVSFVTDDSGNRCALSMSRTEPPPQLQQSGTERWTPVAS
jgi:hypothetical protein